MATTTTWHRLQQLHSKQHKALLLRPGARHPGTPTPSTHLRLATMTAATAQQPQGAHRAPKHPALFTPLQIRDVVARNRVFVSPMCMYSAEDGLPNTFHLVHLGARAIGGAGLVMAEATAVVPEGRISPGDTGLWSDKHTEAWRPIAEFIRSQGAVAAIQLAHAGRKASTPAPWVAGQLEVTPEEGGWEVVAPSAVPFMPGFPQPRELTTEEVLQLPAAFAAAAKRAIDAGFQVIELHFAHGYLAHEFLSPIANKRTDQFGGSFENRIRLVLETTKAVRAVLPEGAPLFARISATDWANEKADGPSWDLPQSIELSRRLKALGVDLIDVSSGGMLPKALIPVGPGYQVPFAESIRKEGGVATGAVGLVTTAAQAEAIVAEGKADAVFLARALLRDPHWPLRAAQELGTVGPWVQQYHRAGKF